MFDFWDPPTRSRHYLERCGERGFDPDDGDLMVRYGTASAARDAAMRYSISQIDADRYGLSQPRLHQLIGAFTIVGPENVYVTIAWRDTSPCACWLF